MPRPKKERKISCDHTAHYFKPRGIPLRDLDEVILDHDEIEAIRLADNDGMSHEECADKMEISRPTFGRILRKARNKIAKSLIEGKAIKINDSEMNKK